MKTGLLSASPAPDLEHKNFILLFYAFLVGLTAGVVGSVFRLTLTFIEVFRDSLYVGAGNSGLTSWLWPILFAVMGISVALFLVKKYAQKLQEVEFRRLKVLWMEYVLCDGNGYCL